MYEEVLRFHITNRALWEASGDLKKKLGVGSGLLILMLIWRSEHDANIIKSHI